MKTKELVQRISIIRNARISGKIYPILLKNNQKSKDEKLFNDAALETLSPLIKRGKILER